MAFVSRPYKILSRFEPYKVTRKGLIICAIIDMFLMTILLNVFWSGLTEKEIQDVRQSLLEAIANDSYLEQQFIKFVFDVLLGFPL